MCLLSLVALACASPWSGAKAATSTPVKKSIATSINLEGVSLPAQTVVYYNARIALRERRFEDVLRLWLLRNALKSKGEAPTHDGDFRSAVWVALSGAGLCHDGLRADDDEDGAGLWPLALHNWLTRSTSKQPAPGQPRSFSSFATGFQQRLFSLHDVLSVEELGAIRFARGNCLRAYFSLPWLDTPHWLDLDDRLSVGITLRDLVVKAGESLKHERVVGEVVLETRLFDLDVAIAKLAKSAVRRETGLLGQLAKTTGVSEGAMAMLREKRLAEVRKSEYTELLRRSLRWNTLNWFSLSQNRRLALFAEAAETYASEVEMVPLLHRTILQNIDVLIKNRDGKELSQWLGFAAAQVALGEDAQDNGDQANGPQPLAKDTSAIANHANLAADGGQATSDGGPWLDEAFQEDDSSHLVEAADGGQVDTSAIDDGEDSRRRLEAEAAARESRRALLAAIALGSRGEALLGLTPEAGFRERAAIALHRGTDYLSRGHSLDAMRSFALAMKRSEESRHVDEVHNLAKRWFGFVLAQHQADEEALALLQSFVSPIDRNELLEVLLWRAAFHGDQRSFDRIASGMRRGGAADFRVRHLGQLAAGDAGAMWKGIRDERAESPHGIYKFAKRLTDELATESLDVRLNNRATLQLAQTLLSEIAEGTNRGLQRRITEQNQRIQTLLDGLELYDESARGKALLAAPGAEAYAGSVRLAPSDPLPWPFSVPHVQTPSPFTAIELTPVEWIDDAGERVFGWHIHER